MDHTITVTNKEGTAAHAGRAFTFRIIEVGAGYGRGRCVTNTYKTMVEVYDATYANAGFEPEGQIVCQYNVDTILGTDQSPRRITGGLNLDGGNPPWTVDADAIAEVMAWLDAYTAVTA